MKKYKGYIWHRKGSLEENRKCLSDIIGSCRELLKQTDLTPLYEYRFYANYSARPSEEIVNLASPPNDEDWIEELNDMWARDNWHSDNPGCHGWGWEYIGPKELTDKLVKNGSTSNI